MKIALLTLSIGMVSCTAIKQLNTEKIISRKNCEILDMNTGIPLVKVTVENDEHSFLFDTGAPKSTINDTAIVKNFHQKEFGSLGYVQGVDKSNKVAKKNFMVAIKTALFESENKIVTYLPMPKTKCGSSKVKGIIGIDGFFNADYPLLLNFTDGKICNIDKNELENHLANKSFRQVKSQCRLNSIYVYLTIGGKAHRFLLDTGFGNQLILPEPTHINLDNYNKMELEGGLFITATSITSGLETCYEKVPVEFVGQKILAKPIVSESARVPLLGIQFIKGFDWIIDYNNNKVYAKRNHLKIDDTFNRKVSYYAKADQKLIVAVKETRQTRYNLGDEIISVNGQKVTPENSCDLQNLLNKTEDWGTLDLEVVPAK